MVNELLSQREIVSNGSLFSVLDSVAKVCRPQQLFAHNVPSGLAILQLVIADGKISSSAVDNSATPSLLGKAKACESLGGFGLSFY